MKWNVYFSKIKGAVCSPEQLATESLDPKQPFGIWKTGLIMSLFLISYISVLIWVTPGLEQNILNLLLLFGAGLLLYWVVGAFAFWFGAVVSAACTFCVAKLLKGKATFSETFRATAAFIPFSAVIGMMSYLGFFVLGWTVPSHKAVVTAQSVTFAESLPLNSWQMVLFTLFSSLVTIYYFYLLGRGISVVHGLTKTKGMIAVFTVPVCLWIATGVYFYLVPTQ